MASSWDCAVSWPARHSWSARARAGEQAAGQPYRITDLELASRLSFLIWSSIPDDELIEVASQNKLHLTPVLERQVHRMLADPKADALVENFGDQLLYLRKLPATSPDGVYYPDWDDELRKSFRRKPNCCSRASSRKIAAWSTCLPPTTHS